MAVRHVSGRRARPPPHRSAAAVLASPRAMQGSRDGRASGPPSLLESTRAHRAELACLELAEGRALLATGAGDGELRLWRWRPAAGWEEAGREARAHRHGTTAVRWAAAGALLASAGVDGAARLWAADGGGGGGLRARRTLLRPGAAAVRALCWAGGGALAAGHEDGAVLLWGAAAGALLARLAPAGAAPAAVRALAALAGGALLLAGGGEGALRVYSLGDLVSRGAEDEVTPVPVACAADAHPEGVTCAAADAEGARLATGGEDGAVRLWAAGRAALAPGAALSGHAAAVSALCWARDGAVLASASLDRSARLWAPAAAACLHAVPAHARYLTCVALTRDFLLTGSNDRTFRTWALGAATLAAEMRPPCDALAHFALGDLEGVELLNLDEDAPAAEEAAEEAAEGGAGEARVTWRAPAHSGAINCIAEHGEFLATASSDGTVKIWRWADSGSLRLEHALAGHRYPALAADFGAAGAVLLTAGADGALLWDVRSGVLVRALAAPGGGVRGARLSRERPPRALLATDDGRAALWSTARPDPRPERTLAALAEAATCCAWAPDARLCAVGGADGDLLLLALAAEGPAHRERQAHDLGVTSCDFAPPAVARAAGAEYLLATAGNDSLVKIWEISLSEGAARCALALAAEAHGGCATSVRWAEGGLLASAGDDGWARAWRLEGARLAPAGGAHCAGGCAAALAVRPGLLCSGGARGELALWRAGGGGGGEGQGERGARLWSAAGAARWLREHAGVALAGAGPAGALTGAALLDAPLGELLAALTRGAEARARLAVELRWLRRAPPRADVEARAPHGLLCPLSHRLLRWPTRAADGFTYERENILEWLLAAPPEGAVSPVSGRRLRRRLAPNLRLLRTLRDFVRREEESSPPGDVSEEDSSPGDVSEECSPPDDVSTDDTALSLR